MRLVLDPCLDGDRDAIARAVRVEIGDDAAPGDPEAVVVRVGCAIDGVDAGAVLEVQRPGTPRRYRYALLWRMQPVDARPRLLGLAVAEAVDASRIELTAVPEPAPSAREPAPPAPPPAPPLSGWAVALVTSQRAFTADAGVMLYGAALMPSRRLTPHVRVEADVAAEGATVIAASGAITVASVSTAPRVVLHAGGQVSAELGFGARLGAVRMRGTPAPGYLLRGQTQVRPWLGPAVSAALGIELTSRVTASAGAELGAVLSGATEREATVPVAVLGGTWRSLTIALAIGL